MRSTDVIPRTIALPQQRWAPVDDWELEDAVRR
jgi:hypothetical protein